MSDLVQGYSGYHREPTGATQMGVARCWQPVPLMPIHATRRGNGVRALCGAPLVEVSDHGWPSTFGACRACLRLTDRAETSRPPVSA